VSSDVYCQSTITENTNDHHIYMKFQEGEREQDAGEKERESVCERGRVAARLGSVSCKNDCWRSGPFGIRIGLK
jgi:hypothetical protein